MIGKDLGRIRLDYLNTFLVLIRNENFSEAAKVLNRSQGTISQQLKDLEDILGCKLIDRTSKRFEITAFGKKLEKTAMNIINEINKTYNSITKERGNIKIKIKIASSSIPGEYFLPKIFTNFQSKNKNFEFHIEITNSKDSIENLLKMNVNFAAVGGLMGKEMEKFDFINLGSDEIVIIGKRTHPIVDELKKIDEGKNIKSAFDVLLKYPWIFREEGSATREYFIEKIPFAKNIKVNLEFQNNLAIIQAVENSNALTALSDYTFEKYKKSNNITIIRHKSLPIIRRDFYFLKLKETTLKNPELELWKSISET